MRHILKVLIAFVILSPSAYAVKTASSFDVSYGMANLTINAFGSDGTLAESRGLNSKTGFQVDYNVAMFDYRTVATLSFAQYQSSNIGDVPLTRLGIGGSYHFFRVNGQRMLMDTDVESKVWGVSPALEVTLGINKLSINDSASFHFTSSLVDITPRLLVEVPMTSSLLLMLRAGYFATLLSSSSPYKIKLSGLVLNLGFKLTTL